EEVAARLKTKVGLQRERFVVSSTHTHCAPALTTELVYIFGRPLPADQARRIERYTRELTEALETVALAALADRKPAPWARGQGGGGLGGQRRGARERAVGKFRGDPKRAGGSEPTGAAGHRRGRPGPGRALRLRLPLHDPGGRIQPDLRRMGRIRLRRDRAGVTRLRRTGDHRLRGRRQPRA